MKILLLGANGQVASKAKRLNAQKLRNTFRQKLMLWQEGVVRMIDEAPNIWMSSSEWKVENKKWA